MPLMKQNAVVPFGKHKGEPVEQLAADPEYCEWLMGQSWFVEKYAHIHTLIINNFGEPNETPEHNRLQLRFLDEVFRRQCMRAAGIAKGFYAEQPLPDFEVGGLDVTWKMASWKLEISNHESQNNTTFHQQDYTLRMAAIHAEMRCRYDQSIIDMWPRQSRDLEEEIQKKQSYNTLDAARAAERLQTARSAYLKSCAEIAQEKESLRSAQAVSDAYTQEYEIVFNYTTISTTYEWQQYEPYHQASIGIECKPVLGDDYPAILRFMRNIRQRPSIYCLVIGALSSQAASLEQLKLVFAQANIVLLTVPEIDATTPMPAWEKHELPNPLEDESFIAITR